MKLRHFQCRYVSGEGEWKVITSAALNTASSLRIPRLSFHLLSASYDSTQVATLWDNRQQKPVSLTFRCHYNGSLSRCLIAHENAPLLWTILYLLVVCQTLRASRCRELWTGILSKVGRSPFVGGQLESFQQNLPPCSVSVKQLHASKRLVQVNRLKNNKRFCNEYGRTPHHEAHLPLSTGSLLHTH
jgi:hypothetical protein